MVSCLRWCLPLSSKLSCLPRGVLSSLDVFLVRNSVFLSCLPRWKCSGDSARLSNGEPGLGEVWGVIVARCGDAGDPRKVKGEVLRGWCEWPWPWEGEAEVGEGVLAKGDTGTCADDFLLGERTARNFGISPWSVPKKTNHRKYSLFFLADKGLLSFKMTKQENYMSSFLRRRNLLRNDIKALHYRGLITDFTAN